MKKYLGIAAGLLASAALMMAASPAMAHVDVGINIGVPGFYQAPVYVEPRPVYVQPQPVYVQPEPVYVQENRVYVEPPPVYIERENSWRERQWDEGPGEEKQ